MSGSGVERGGILRLRRGRSPNCSAVGSVVGIALASAVLGAALVNAFADRLARWLLGPGGGSSSSPGPSSSSSSPGDADPRPRLRREAFGALLAWDAPPALLHLDPVAAALAAPKARPWGEASPESVPGALRAPTELHVAVTERCPAACEGCYLEADPSPREEPDRAVLVEQLRQAAEAGVFEVAFGGGEAGLREDLLELAAEARSLGLVPNLTTSGFGITAARAARMAGLFGQVNVSLDGLGADYAAVRGWDGVELGLAALRTLRRAGVAVGVNTVLSRRNLAGLPALGERLLEEGVTDWQWLRFKPAGRGRASYGEHALAAEEAAGLWPLALGLEERGLRIRFDCALVPFLAMHLPDPAEGERLDVVGCVAGERLLTRDAGGRWRPCSFAGQDAGDGPLMEAWASASTLRAWRAYAEQPPEPCASCAWHGLCRGGCRVVAEHLRGDPLRPDPECPRVRAWEGRAVGRRPLPILGTHDR